MKFLYQICLIGCFLFSCKKEKKIEPKINNIVAQDTNSEVKTKDTIVVNTIKSTIPTITYNGEDLGFLSNQYYGNKAYKTILASYNRFTGNRAKDKKQDSLKIPDFSTMVKDPDLGLIDKMSEEIKTIVIAKTIFEKHEKFLWKLPVDKNNRNFQTLPESVKLDVLAASKQLFHAIDGLKAKPNPPTKAIGQFKQVAENLNDIAMGKIDENKYALDMVHQRLAHGFMNAIQWAKK